LLNRILSNLNITEYPEVLAGTKNSEDAGIYKLNNNLALVQSVDFFTPVVNDPYIFGKITACNALSDIYAMGGTPLTAMNVLEFPVKQLPSEYAQKILEGALAILDEAKTAMIGGHSVDGKELKYGLSVTGIISPDKIYSNEKAEKGDMLILTKKIGTGAIATAIKAEMASEKAETSAIKEMTTLNKKAAEIIKKYESVHSVTDITGFGLMGHLIEMLTGSEKNCELFFDNIKFLEEAREYLEFGLIPEGTYNNQKFFSCKVRFEKKLSDIDEFLLYDPQTSGGLLIAISKNSANSLLSELKNNNVEANIVAQITEHGKGNVTVL
jgi:selenide,water dikinase